MTSLIRDRIAGGIYGLLIGDALGVPYEFQSAAAIPAAEAIEYEPPAGFRRSHARVPPGTWSDDGALALQLLKSLLDRGRFDADDFGRRLVAWHDRGELAVDGKVFDVGIQTSRAIGALKAGKPALDAGPTDEYANGNGSLMRVLPLAIWHRADDLALVYDAMSQSRVTHGHPRSQVCCALYCLWARRVLEGFEPDSAWEGAVAAIRSLSTTSAPWQPELEFCLENSDCAGGEGTGYVLDTLHSARWAVQTARGDFEKTVRAAIRLGNDTDTTACVAGGIAGLHVGHAAIPQRWRNHLRGREWVDPMIEKLCTHCDAK